MSQNILSRVPINGYIKLESIETVDKVPDYTTVGGFHFKSKNGAEISFDWLSGYGQIDICDQTGRLFIEMELENFDRDYLLENLKIPDTERLPITWNELIHNGTVEELFYEAHNEGEDESDRVPMEVKSFGVFAWCYETKKQEDIFLTDAQLQEYNKKQKKEWNWN